MCFPWPFLQMFIHIKCSGQRGMFSIIYKSALVPWEKEKEASFELYSWEWSLGRNLASVFECIFKLSVWGLPCCSSPALPISKAHSFILWKLMPGCFLKNKARFQSSELQNGWADMALSHPFMLVADFCAICSDYICYVCKRDPWVSVGTDEEEK